MILFRATRFASSQSGKFFETVCDGCETSCTDCNLDADENGTPLCREELKHTKSAGGNTPLKMLSIDKGYWRATDTSTDVRVCYNADACSGGTTGSPDFCEKGYEGPCERRLFQLFFGVICYILGSENGLNKVD